MRQAARRVKKTVHKLDKADKKTIQKCANRGVPKVLLRLCVLVAQCALFKDYVAEELLRCGVEWHMLWPIMVEFFAGVHVVTSCFLRKGFFGIPYEILLNNAMMDILSPRGYAFVVFLAFRILPGGFAPVC